MHFGIRAVAPVLSALVVLGVGSCPVDIDRASAQVVGVPSPASVAQQATVSFSSDVARLAQQQGTVSSRGLWENYDPVYWRVASGPALSAAAVAAATGDTKMLTIARRTFNELIRTHQRTNGSYSSTGPEAQPVDIDTMFFATNLGMALRVIGGRLNSATRAFWTRSLLAAASYLVTNGNLSWYTNGNIVIGNALVMALAFDATGDQRWHRYYERAWTFAVSPSQARWPGFGFKTIKPSENPDGSDGEGFFAEDGGSSPGFDADYAELQLSQLARLYLVTGDASVMKMLNMSLNYELRFVNFSTWALNTSGGTRHPQVGRYVPFDTPALAVAAYLCHRVRLRRYVESQLRTLLGWAAGVPTYWNPGSYYNYGLQATFMMLTGRVGPSDHRTAG